MLVIKWANVRIAGYLKCVKMRQSKKGQGEISHMVLFSDDFQRWPATPQTRLVGASWMTPYL